MSQPTIPPAGAQAAFERARDIHQTARDAHATLHGASRQISAARSPVSVEQAIANAAQQSTVDFDFLVAQAQVESAMDPNARAQTSSATGLYQFIESTWINTMQRHGERFGLGDIAAHINVSEQGTAYITDPATRAEILNLRNDPQIASLMAAGLAEDNRAHLTSILGRQPDHGELYLAHFLGAGAAGRFLSAMADNPHQRADALFRRPAAANQAIFYERNGSPRSLKGVMDHLSSRLERGRDYAGLVSPDIHSPTPLSPPQFSLPATPPPHIIANNDVFSSANPPTLTRRNRPAIPAADTLNQAAIPARAPISSVVQSALGSGQIGLSADSSRQVQRAYEQLRALGL